MGITDNPGTWHAFSIPESREGYRVRVLNADLDDIAAVYARFVGNESEEAAEEKKEIPKLDQEIEEKKQKDPLFQLGDVVATPGALEALLQANQLPDLFLQRHQSGDWGEVPEEDRAENDLAVRKGFRLLSAYKLDTGEKIWVITEWNRSVTTILLPDEY